MAEHPNDQQMAWAILQLPDWANEVISWLVGGQNWPEGSETLLEELADRWEALGETIQESNESFAAATETLAAGWEGPSFNQFLAIAESSFLNYDQGLPAVAQATSAYAGQLRQFAMEVNYAKISINIGFYIALIGAFLSIALSWVPGAAPTIAGAVRVALMQVIKKVLQKLLLAAGRKAAAKAITKLTVKEITVTFTKAAGKVVAQNVAKRTAGQVAKDVGKEIVEEVAEETFIDYMAQSQQIAEGRRTEFDIDQLKASAVGGAAGAVVGSAASPVLGKIPRPKNAAGQVVANLGVSALSNMIASPAGSIIATLAIYHKLDLSALSLESLLGAATSALGRPGRHGPFSVDTMVDVATALGKGGSSLASNFGSNKGAGAASTDLGADTQSTTTTSPSSSSQSAPSTSSSGATATGTGSNTASSGSPASSGASATTSDAGSASAANSTQSSGAANSSASTNASSDTSSAPSTSSSTATSTSSPSTSTSPAVDTTTGETATSNSTTAPSTAVDTNTATDTGANTNTAADTNTSTATDTGTTSTGTNTATDTSTAVDTNTNTNASTNTETATNNSTDVASTTNTTGDQNTDTASNPTTDTNTSGDTNTQTSTNTDSSTNSATTTGTSANTNTDTNTSANTNTNTTSDTNTATSTTNDTANGSTATNTSPSTDAKSNVSTNSTTDATTATNTTTSTDTNTATDATTATNTATDATTATNTATDTNPTTDTSTSTTTDATTDSSAVADTGSDTSTNTNTNIDSNAGGVTQTAAPTQQTTQPGTSSATDTGGRPVKPSDPAKAIHAQLENTELSTRGMTFTAVDVETTIRHMTSTNSSVMRSGTHDAALASLVAIIEGNPSQADVDLLVHQRTEADAFANFQAAALAQARADAATEQNWRGGPKKGPKKLDSDTLAQAQALATATANAVMGHVAPSAVNTDSAGSRTATSSSTSTDEVSATDVPTTTDLNDDGPPPTNVAEHTPTPVLAGDVGPISTAPNVDSNTANQRTPGASTSSQSNATQTNHPASDTTSHNDTQSAATADQSTTQADQSATNSDSAPDADQNQQQDQQHQEVLIPSGGSNNDNLNNMSQAEQLVAERARLMVQNMRESAVRVATTLAGESIPRLDGGSTHISTEMALQVHEHLFGNQEVEHRFGDTAVNLPFAGDPAITEAWLRLASGDTTHLQDDVTLIAHEVAEIDAMANGMSQADAHDAANAVANWESTASAQETAHPLVDTLDQNQGVMTGGTYDTDPVRSVEHFIGTAASRILAERFPGVPTTVYGWEVGGVHPPDSPTPPTHMPPKRVADADPGSLRDAISTLGAGAALQIAGNPHLNPDTAPDPVTGKTRRASPLNYLDATTLSTIAADLGLAVDPTASRPDVISAISDHVVSITTAPDAGLNAEQLAEFNARQQAAIDQFADALTSNVTNQANLRQAIRTPIREHFSHLFLETRESLDSRPADERPVGTAVHAYSEWSGFGWSSQFEIDHTGLPPGITMQTGVEKFLANLDGPGIEAKLGYKGSVDTDGNFKTAKGSELAAQLRNELDASRRETRARAINFAREHVSQLQDAAPATDAETLRREFSEARDAYLRTHPIALTVVTSNSVAHEAMTRLVQGDPELRADVTVLDKAEHLRQLRQEYEAAQRAAYPEIVQRAQEIVDARNDRGGGIGPTGGRANHQGRQGDNLGPAERARRASPAFHAHGLTTDPNNPDALRTSDVETLLQEPRKSGKTALDLLSQALGMEIALDATADGSTRLVATNDARALTFDLRVESTTPVGAKPSYNDPVVEADVTRPADHQGKGAEQVRVANVALTVSPNLRPQDLHVVLAQEIARVDAALEPGARNNTTDLLVNSPGVSTPPVISPDPTSPSPSLSPRDHGRLAGAAIRVAELTNLDRDERTSLDEVLKTELTDLGLLAKVDDAESTAAIERAVTTLAAIPDHDRFAGLRASIAQTHQSVTSSGDLSTASLHITRSVVNESIGLAGTIATGAATGTLGGLTGPLLTAGALVFAKSTSGIIEQRSSNRRSRKLESESSIDVALARGLTHQKLEHREHQLALNMRPDVDQSAIPPRPSDAFDLPVADTLDAIFEGRARTSEKSQELAESTTAPPRDDLATRGLASRATRLFKLLTSPVVMFASTLGTAMFDGFGVATFVSMGGFALSALHAGGFLSRLKLPGAYDKESTDARRKDDLAAAKARIRQVAADSAILAEHAAQQQSEHNILERFHGQEDAAQRLDEIEERTSQGQDLSADDQATLVALRREAATSPDLKGVSPTTLNAPTLEAKLDNIISLTEAAVTGSTWSKANPFSRVRRRFREAFAELNAAAKQLADSGLDIPTSPEKLAESQKILVQLATLQSVSISLQEKLTAVYEHPLRPTATRDSLGRVFERTSVEDSTAQASKIASGFANANNLVAAVASSTISAILQSVTKGRLSHQLEIVTDLGNFHNKFLKDGLSANLFAVSDAVLSALAQNASAAILTSRNEALIERIDALLSSSSTDAAVAEHVLAEPPPTARPSITAETVNDETPLVPGARVRLSQAVIRGVVGAASRFTDIVLQDSALGGAAAVGVGLGTEVATEAVGSAADAIQKRSAATSEQTRDEWFKAREAHAERALAEQQLQIARDPEFQRMTGLIQTLTDIAASADATVDSAINRADMIRMLIPALPQGVRGNSAVTTFSRAIETLPVPDDPIDGRLKHISTIRQTHTVQEVIAAARDGIHEAHAILDHSHPSTQILDLDLDDLVDLAADHLTAELATIRGQLDELTSAFQRRSDENAHLLSQATDETGEPSADVASVAADIAQAGESISDALDGLNHTRADLDLTSQSLSRATLQSVVDTINGGRLERPAAQIQELRTSLAAFESTHDIHSRALADVQLREQSAHLTASATSALESSRPAVDRAAEALHAAQQAGVSADALSAALTELVEHRAAIETASTRASSVAANSKRASPREIQADRHEMRSLNLQVAALSVALDNDVAVIERQGAVTQALVEARRADDARAQYDDAVERLHAATLSARTLGQTVESIGQSNRTLRKTALAAVAEVRRSARSAATSERTVAKLERRARAASAALMNEPTATDTTTITERVARLAERVGEVVHGAEVTAHQLDEATRLVNLLRVSDVLDRAQHSATEVDAILAAARSEDGQTTSTNSGHLASFAARVDQQFQSQSATLDHVRAEHTAQIDRLHGFVSGVLDVADAALRELNDRDAQILQGAQALATLAITRAQAINLAQGEAAFAESSARLAAEQGTLVRVSAETANALAEVPADFVSYNGDGQQVELGARLAARELANARAKLDQAALLQQSAADAHAELTRLVASGQYPSTESDALHALVTLTPRVTELVAGAHDDLLLAQRNLASHADQGAVGERSTSTAPAHPAERAAHDAAKAHATASRIAESTFAQFDTVGALFELVRQLPRGISNDLDTHIDSSFRHATSMSTDAQATQNQVDTIASYAAQARGCADQVHTATRGHDTSRDTESARTLATQAGAVLAELSRRAASVDLDAAQLRSSAARALATHALVVMQGERAQLEASIDEFTHTHKLDLDVDHEGRAPRPAADSSSNPELAAARESYAAACLARHSLDGLIDRAMGESHHLILEAQRGASAQSLSDALTQWISRAQALRVTAEAHLRTPSDGHADSGLTHDEPLIDDHGRSEREPADVDPEQDVAQLQSDLEDRFAAAGLEASTLDLRAQRVAVRASAAYERARLLLARAHELANDPQSGSSPQSSAAQDRAAKACQEALDEIGLAQSERRAGDLRELYRSTAISLDHAERFAGSIEVAKRLLAGPRLDPAIAEPLSELVRVTESTLDALGVTTRQLEDLLQRCDAPSRIETTDGWLTVEHEFNSMRAQAIDLSHTLSTLLDKMDLASRTADYLLRVDAVLSHPGRLELPTADSRLAGGVDESVSPDVVDLERLGEIVASLPAIRVDLASAFDVLTESSGALDEEVSTRVLALEATVTNELSQLRASIDNVRSEMAARLHERVTQSLSGVRAHVVDAGSARLQDSAQIDSIEETAVELALRSGLWSSPASTRELTSVLAELDLVLRASRADDTLHHEVSAQLLRSIELVGELATFDTHLAHVTHLLIQLHPTDIRAGAGHARATGLLEAAQFQAQLLEQRAALHQQSERLDLAVARFGVPGSTDESQHYIHRAAELAHGHALLESAERLASRHPRLARERADHARAIANRAADADAHRTADRNPTDPVDADSTAGSRHETAMPVRDFIELTSTTFRAAYADYEQARESLTTRIETSRNLLTTPADDPTLDAPVKQVDALRDRADGVVATWSTHLDRLISIDWLAGPDSVEGDIAELHDAFDSCRAELTSVLVSLESTIATMHASVDMAELNRQSRALDSAVELIGLIRDDLGNELSSTKSAPAASRWAVVDEQLAMARSAADRVRRSFTPPTAQLADDATPSDTRAVISDGFAAVHATTRDLETLVRATFAEAINALDPAVARGKLAIIELEEQRDRAVARIRATSNDILQLQGRAPASIPVRSSLTELAALRRDAQRALWWDKALSTLRELIEPHQINYATNHPTTTNPGPSLSWTRYFDRRDFLESRHPAATLAGALRKWCFIETDLRCVCDREQPTDCPRF